MIWFIIFENIFSTDDFVVTGYAVMKHLSNENQPLALVIRTYPTLPYRHSIDIVIGT